MNCWMIAAVLLALAAGALMIVCIRQQDRINAARAQQQETDLLRQETAELRGENAQWRRENAMLHRALQNEQAHGDEAERELIRQQELVTAAEQRAEQINARRIDAERAVYAEKMRNDLLEKQLLQLQKEQRTQEQIYQDILRERDDTIAALQSQQQKRRERKKAAVLDQQITISDILKGV